MPRLLVAIAALSLPIGALAQTCTPGWVRTFGEGVSSSGAYAAYVKSQAIFDPDGAGPLPVRLVIAGNFDTAGGIPAQLIASWDGARWYSMSAGLPIQQYFGVNALYRTHDTQILYVGGNFLDEAFFARWDGASWSSLPSPAAGQYLFPSIDCLRSFDPDDDGPAPEHLIAAVSRGFDRYTTLWDWDGLAWTQIPGSWVNRATEMTVFRPSGGPSALYVAISGMQHSQSSFYIIRWDGVQATAIAAQSCNSSCRTGDVNALEAFHDQFGGSLYAGGTFTTIGGVSASSIARWDGQAWHAADTSLGPYPEIQDLAVFDFDGPGPGLPQLIEADLYELRTWLGANWAPAPFTTYSYNGGIRLVPFDDGVTSLFAVGGFSVTGNNFTSRVARTIGSLWAPVGQSLNNSVHALAGNSATTGSLPAGVYAGGAFYTAGNTFAAGIARWDGNQWSALGGGTDNHVDALTVATINSAAALYAGGKFNVAGGVIAPHIARWNGLAWSALGAGLNDQVQALAPMSGSLYAGGAFTASGAAPLSHIARWDGAAWTPLSSGMNGNVHALAAASELSSVLYAGGAFTAAGGASASHIARWNGAWSALGDGLNGSVRALAFYDDGSGAALYAGGDFSSSGSTPVSRIARWNGLTWTALGQGLDAAVDSLIVADPDGPGPFAPRLIVGGEFTHAGGVSVNHLAQWDGSAWSPLGGGADDGSVLALAAYDADGAGPQLSSIFLGGEFRNVGGASSPGIAQWLPCPCYANCDNSAASPILTANDFQCFITRYVAADPYANCDGSTGNPLLTPNDFLCFLDKYVAGCP